MKKRALAIALLATGFCNAAQADMTFHIMNNTKKPLEFSLMVPRTKTYSNLKDGRVEPGKTGHFATSQILPKCTAKKWRCAKLKPVVQHWGKYVVFIQCPKAYNSRSKTNLWYKLTGNDTAHLRCRRVSKPKSTA